MTNPNLIRFRHASRRALDDLETHVTRAVLTLALAIPSPRLVI